MPLQISETLVPGYVEPEKFALKRRHRQLNQLLCARCQGLSNGEMIPGVADFQQLINRETSSETTPEEATRDRPSGFFSAKALATPDQLRDQLRSVRNSRALVVLLIDLLDASGSMLGRVRDLIGGNPIIVVGTKADLLPNGATDEDVEEWLCGALAFKRIATESVHVVSSRTGDGVSEAVAAVRRSRLGRDVYIMGAANVGKSSFVRALVKDMSSMKSRQYDPLAPGRSKHLPVESAMPGTTLRTIPLEVFSSGGTLFDTPGLHLHHRVPHILTPEENKELHPRKKLRGYVAPPPSELAMASQTTVNLESSPQTHNDEGEVPEEAQEPALASYIWGGLARVDVLECPPETQLIFYGPTALKVQGVPGGAAAEVGEAAGFGAESVAARGGLRVARVVEIEVEADEFESIGDVALSGVPGWLAIVAGPRQRRRRQGSGQVDVSSSVNAVRLRVWAPVGVEVFLRPSLPVNTLALLEGQQ